MDLREHLQAIYDARGRLTPADVVEVARDPDHPLHNRFEWDDVAAGEAWRRTQAQEMIRSVKVTYRDRSGTEQRTRAFVAVRTPLVSADEEADINGGYRYIPVETIARDDLLARQALAEMEREWKTLRRKYDQFAEFWELVRDDVSELDEAA